MVHDASYFMKTLDSTNRNKPINLPIYPSFTKFDGIETTLYCTSLQKNKPLGQADEPGSSDPSGQSQ